MFYIVLDEPQEQILEAMLSGSMVKAYKQVWDIYRTPRNNPRIFGCSAIDRGNDGYIYNIDNLSFVHELTEDEIVSEIAKYNFDLGYKNAKTLDDIEFMFSHNKVPKKIYSEYIIACFTNKQKALIFDRMSLGNILTAINYGQITKKEFISWLKVKLCLR